MAKIGARGASKIESVSYDTVPEDNYYSRVTYTFCSDGRVLQKFQLKAVDKSYTTPSSYTVKASHVEPSKWEKFRDSIIAKHPNAEVKKEG